MPIFETRQFRMLSANMTEFKAQPSHRIWGLTACMLSELLALILHGDELDAFNKRLD